jgi:hypothetical protein
MIFSILLLRTSNPGAFVVWCVLGLCAGLYLFFHGFRLLQRRHLILDTPASKIRSASMGLVELSGLAVGPYTMVAPITARPCYYHRTFVWEWKQEFCDGFFTTKQEAPPSVRSFLSRHGISTTNKIKVEEFCIKPKNALFLLGTLDENPGLELTPRPIHDDDSTGFVVGNALSFSLDPGIVRKALSPVIGDGDVLSGLSLTGGLQHDPAFDEIYDKAISTTSSRVIRLSPNPAPTKSADMTQQQKIAAALLKAGVSNPAAWAAAGATPSSVALSNNPNGSPHDGTANGNSQLSPSDGFDPHPPVVLMKGKNNPTFLISWRSQRDLARSLGWKCTLMIWGGPALTLLSLYALLEVTHWL